VVVLLIIVAVALLALGSGVLVVALGRSAARADSEMEQELADHTADGAVEEPARGRERITRAPAPSASDAGVAVPRPSVPTAGPERR